jgi:GH35 family endo-1,4-beta-xylanase
MKVVGPGLLLGLAAVGFLVVAAASYARSTQGNDLRFWLAAAWSSFNVPPVETADEVPVTPKVTNPLGVNTFLEQEVEPEKRARALRMARDAGFHWIRQQFRWEEIEPLEKGVYVVPRYGNSSWEKYDNIVDLAGSMGVEVIARLDTVPFWARGASDHAFSPPERLSDYGDFVEAVVSRYRGRVRYYQIWNEPNLSFEWGNRAPDPEAFAELLKLAAQRARAADPNAVILAPALAPTTAMGSEAMDELVYLQRMYDAGARPYFDIASVQAYGLRSGPDDRRLGEDDVNFSRPLRFREVMVRNGDAAKPVWISEMGWNATPEAAPGPNRFGKVTADQQARYTVRALERARAEWPWVGVINVWFLKRADDHDAETQLAGFRLLDPDFTPRPVYEAVRDYATRVGLRNAG